MGRPHRWKGALLEELRVAYADRSQTTKEIARRYGMHVSGVTRLAHRHGWPIRPVSTLPKKNSIRQMTPQQRTIYFKLRHDLQMPQNQAAQEACR